ncbi:MAG: hypothetical protein WD048_05140 [Chitinophagales bacterium]
MAPWDWRKISKEEKIAFAESTQTEIPLFENESNTLTDKNTVLICGGSSATKYHNSSNCKGVKSCKGEMSKISKDAAESKGRGPCSFCY